ncbi:unnamed protein product, partial [Mesorhabditis belari]|uniref:Uncharacterized protein n=1 Tax=Mesorhabditis belari TaxID=2138241 RepID=A0AAF3J5P0_9BILA
MDLKLFWLLTQLGNIFYGINATIVIFTCFPNARKCLMQVIRRRVFCGTQESCGDFLNLRPRHSMFNQS